jgi:hypothetical protein
VARSRSGKELAIVTATGTKDLVGDANVPDEFVFRNDGEVFAVEQLYGVGFVRVRRQRDDGERVHPIRRVLLGGTKPWRAERGEKEEDSQQAPHLQFPPLERTMGSSSFERTMR